MALGFNRVGANSLSATLPRYDRDGGNGRSVAEGGAAARRLPPQGSRRGGDPQARRPSRLRSPPSVTAARRPQLVRAHGGRGGGAAAFAPLAPAGPPAEPPKESS